MPKREAKNTAAVDTGEVEFLTVDGIAAITYRGGMVEAFFYEERPLIDLDNDVVQNDLSCVRRVNAALRTSKKNFRAFLREAQRVELNGNRLRRTRKE